MPRVAAHTGARVTQWLELQPSLGKPGLGTIRQQPRAIGGDEVRHRTSFPDVAMQPESAIHGVNHSLAT